MPVPNIPAPLQTPMFIREGVLSVPWATFFAQFADWRKDIESLFVMLANLRGPRPSAYSNKPQFSVNRNGANQIGVPTTTFTKLQWTNKVYDDPGTFDATTNYRWTPGRIGRAHISARVTWNTMVANSFLAIAVYKNGASHRQMNMISNTTGFAQGPSISIDVDVAAATDYFEIWVDQETGGTIDVHGGTDYTWFMGHMIA